MPIYIKTYPYLQVLIPTSIEKFLETKVLGFLLRLKGIDAYEYQKVLLSIDLNTYIKSSLYINRCRCLLSSKDIDIYQ